MLNTIRIRDFAIIDELEVNLNTGMSALTGETGAGKSILIDALGLALGDRADAGVVRVNCKRAEISATFNITRLPDATAWLVDNDLDDGDDCLIRRTIAAEGRSKGFINGSPVPMQSLRALGELLIDIHGQHEHQSLLRNDEQRRLLDDFSNHSDLLSKLSKEYEAWREANNEYQRLSAAAQDRDAQLDLLRYQVNELDNLAPQEDEYDHINLEHARLANVSRLQTTGHLILENLEDSEDHAASTVLARAVTSLDELRGVDTQLGELSDSLNGALAEVQEAVSGLRNYLDGLDADPARLEEVETRIGSLLDFARKHHIKPDELPAKHQQLKDELDGLEHAETRLEGLQEDIALKLISFNKLAKKLSASRKKQAALLSKQVTEHMQALGMPGGRFEIELEPRDDNVPSALGMERVVFTVSANPGQPAKALNKVASGGELSRISLAIQVVLADNVHIPTLIFDEVDVGIGGGVAEIVGSRLRALAENRQVLCVTHLAQVAAQAHNHLQVSKSRGKDSTGTNIKTLDEAGRSQEIARMLGGVEITKQTLAHAEEMIERAKAS